jgi:hypothetical protein
MDRDPTKCNELVFKYGQNIGYVANREEADTYCRVVQEQKGGLCDWNYVGGRCMAKHLTQEKLDAINILDELIDGEDDELSSLLLKVKEGLLPERTMG